VDGEAARDAHGPQLIGRAPAGSGDLGHLCCLWPKAGRFARGASGPTCLVDSFATFAIPSRLRVRVFRFFARWSGGSPR
jgi:hypothetical protein